jgi:hypothetical protein
MPRSPQPLSDGVVTFTGAVVVLVVLFESPRRAGQHPAVVRAKSAARVPSVCGGDAVIVLAVLRHYLHRIGANVLGVPTDSQIHRGSGRERAGHALGPGADDGLDRGTISQTLEGS